MIDCKCNFNEEVKTLSFLRKEISVKELHRTLKDKVNKVYFIYASHNKKRIFSLAGRYWREKIIIKVNSYCHRIICLLKLPEMGYL